MKFAVVILAFVAAVSAQTKYDRFGYPIKESYRFTTQSPYRYRPAVTPTVTPAPIFVRPTQVPLPNPIPAVRLNDERSAETLRSSFENNPDGSFTYFYETNNGISAQAQGSPRTFPGNPPVSPVVISGNYAYTGQDGVPVAISYTADENGYHPSGDALPTPPPLPPQIARALAYTLKNYPTQ